ncbi:MAG: ketol-acid reductoisomerase [Phycisphaerales bacterium]|nr:ketol-acid reductoisomerase [Phycisphaerales bacterium]
MMTLPVYYENDADPLLLGSKTVAVLGYGSQGRAHAQNLRDSGNNVLVAQRTGSRNHESAVDDGFDPLSLEEAVRRSDLLIFALPDETMGDIYAKQIAPFLKHGQALGFVHGFSVHFRQINPPAEADVIMVAPKGPGTLVREAYTRGGGLTCILAVHQDATGHARQLALAWGAAIGGGRGGMIETTFAAECEADLFGEQTVLCGGVIELMKVAYETLVEAGFPEEVAYFECVHEVKQVVDLQYAGGLAAMRQRISNTASYGGLTRGPRLVNEKTRTEMQAILQEIQTGRFAREWLDECRSGKKHLDELETTESQHSSEAAGRTVRNLARKAKSG